MLREADEYHVKAGQVSSLLMSISAHGHHYDERFEAKMRLQNKPYIE